MSIEEVLVKSVELQGEVLLSTDRLATAVALPLITKPAAGTMLSFPVSFGA